MTLSIHSSVRPHLAVSRPTDAVRSPAPVGARTLLVAVCASALVAGALAGDASPRLLADPDLASLLRGMALLKGAALVGAFAVVAWRFGRPVRAPVVFGYLAATAAMTVATVLVWRLAWLVPAAITFHVGLLAFLVIAWKDDLAGSVFGERDRSALRPERRS